MGHGKLTSYDIIQAFEGLEFFIAKKQKKWEIGNWTFEYINEYGSGFLRMDFGKNHQTFKNVIN